jgi:hypothetical protein
MELDKNFWQDVQREFLSKEHCYICNSSELFKIVFKTERSQVLEISAKFLLQYEDRDLIDGPEILILFPLKNFHQYYVETASAISRKIREDFLTFAIQKLLIMEELIKLVEEIDSESSIFGIFTLDNKVGISGGDWLNEEVSDPIEKWCADNNLEVIWEAEVQDEHFLNLGYTKIY